MDQLTKVPTHELASTCVRCQARLSVLVQPEPRPGRPHDKRVTYTCNRCQFQVLVHERVNPPARYVTRVASRRAV